MNDFVIRPLTKEEVFSFFDSKSKEVIKYFIIKSLFSQPEPRIDQKHLPIQMPKEHIEQWFTQALKVKSVGSGSYPIDIYNESEHWGADVKMLNMKVFDDGRIRNTSSGEASLGQKFTETGLDLDALFKNGNYEEIKNGWINLYKLKYASLKIKYPSISKIYYFFVLRPGVQESGTNLYVTGAILNLDKLKKVTIGKTTESSVYLNKFISEELGNVKIYKAKKRLELRLRPKKWIDSNYAVKISTSFSPEKTNLRDTDMSADFLKNELEKMKSLEVKFEE